MVLFLQMITKSCWNGAASGRFSGVGRSVPYAMGVFGNQRELAGNDASPCGGRGFGPPGSSAPTEGLPKSRQRADVPKAWLPPTKFRSEIWGVSHRHRPLRPAGDGTPGRRALRVVAESRRDCPGQRRTAERLRRGREGWVGIGAEITPKRGHQPRTIPQSRLRRASSLYTREPWGTGGGGVRSFSC